MEHRDSKLKRMVDWAGKRCFARLPVLALLSVAYAFMAAGGRIKAAAGRLRWRQLAALGMALVMLVSFFPLSLALASNQSDDSLVVEAGLPDSALGDPSVPDPSDPSVAPDDITPPEDSTAEDAAPDPVDSTTGTEDPAPGVEESTAPPEDSDSESGADSSVLPDDSDASAEDSSGLTDGSDVDSEDSSGLTEDSDSGAGDDSSAVDGSDSDSEADSSVADSSDSDSEDGSDLTDDSDASSEDSSVLPDDSDSDTGDVSLEEGEETAPTLVAFLPLEEDVAEQTWPLGTLLEELTLPETLLALPADEADAEQAADGQTVDGDSVPDGETPVAEAPTAIEVPVAAWQAEPDYDPDTEGAYQFTPSFAEDLVLAEDIVLPVVVVTLEEEYPLVEAEETWGDKIAESLVDLRNEIEMAIDGEPTIIAVASSIALTNTDVTIEIPSTKDITLAGSMIYRQTGTPFRGRMFTVEGKLTLQSIVLEGNSTNNVEGTGALVYVTETGSLTLKNGAILRNNTARAVESLGPIVMDGGSITNNSCSANNGGGVHISGNAGTMTMNGGTISDNAAVYVMPNGGAGGGVYLATAANSMTMTGGTISGNTAGISGGGVHCMATANFTMTDGAISGNRAEDDFYKTITNGGGIAIGQGTAIISGGAVITGNHADSGGGISAAANSKVYVIDGGQITNNSSTGQGGGIYSFYGQVILAETGTATISGNTNNAVTSSSNACGAGIALDLGTLNMYPGATITGNRFIGAASTSGCGGGIAAINMSAVNIAGGTATGNGGGLLGADVYLKNSTATMSGAPTIGGGTAGLYSNADGQVIIHDAGDLEPDAAICLETGGTIGNGFIYVTKATNNISSSEFDSFVMSNPSYKKVLQNNTTPKTIKLEDVSSTPLQVRIENATSGTAENPVSVPVWPDDAKTGVTILIGNTVGNDPRHIKLVAANNATGVYTRYGTFSDALFQVPAGSTLVLENITLDGGGQEGSGADAIVNVAAGGSLTLLEGAVLQNNAARAVYNAGTMTMAGGEINANKSPQVASASVYGSNGYGGGIYTAGSGTLNLTGGSITGNWATEGGGVYIAAGSTATMTGTSITGNSAAVRGGGLYLAQSFTLASGTVAGNKLALTGSAVNLAQLQGAGIYLADGTLTINSGASVSGNTITAAAAETLACGAGVAAQGDVVLAGGSIQDNRVTAGTAQGAGVYAGGTLEITGGSITGNSASLTGVGNKGGGVYLAGDGGVLTMLTGLISGNSAAAGGGVYLGNDEGQLASATIAGNARIAGNSAANGGGIYNTGNLRIGGTANIGATTDGGNTATGYGDDLYHISGVTKLAGTPHIGYKGRGGAYVASTIPLSIDTTDISGARVYLEEGNIDFSRWVATRDGTEFSAAEVAAFMPANTAYYVMADNNDTSGNPPQPKPKCIVLYNASALPLQTRIDLATGGDAENPITVPIWVHDQVNTAIVIGTTNNPRHIRLTAGDSALGAGGYQRHDLWAGDLFQVLPGSSLTLENVKLDGDQRGSGALVHLLSTSAGGGELIMGNGAELTRNGASGVVVEQRAQLTINGGTISQNRSTDGAGVYTAGTVRMNGGVINSNQATDGGGGVYVAPTGALIMANGTIGTSNTANKAAAGAGVYVAGSFSMTGAGARVSGNSTVGSTGGGVHVALGGTFVMSDGRVDFNNVAGGTGGGVHNDGSFTMSGGSISSNKVSGNSQAQGGAGVYSTRSLTLKGTVDGNTAQGVPGAGIYVAGGTLTLDGARVLSNVAGGPGGGIYLADGTLTATNNAAINNNEATTGGGVYVGPTANFSMTGGNVNNNATNGNGGGIAVQRAASTTFVLDGTSFSNNTASRDGAGLYIESPAATTTTITGGTLQSNGATGAGGGLMVTGAATVTLKDGVQLLSNTANKNGGGLMVAGNATVTLGDGVQLQGNRAANGGAAGLDGGTLTLDGAAIGTTTANTVTNAATGQGKGIYIPEGSTLRFVRVSFGNGNGFVAENEDAVPVIAAAGLPENSIPVEAIPGAEVNGVVIARADSTGYTQLTEDDAKALVAPNGYRMTVNSAKTQVIIRPIVYTITYHVPEGVQNPNPTSYTILDDDITLQGLASHAGSRFGRWSTAESGGTVWTVIPQGSTGNLVLYAQWVQQYAVRYLANAGTDNSVAGMPDPPTVLYDGGENYSLSDAVPTRTNYVFDSWNTEADGSGSIRYEPGRDMGTIGADLTLHAQWVRLYTLQFKGNGDGVGDVPNSRTERVGTSVTIESGMSPNWQGRRFLGWNTQADGRGIGVPVGGSVTLNSDITLWAQWEGALLIAFDGRGNGDPVGNLPDDTAHVTGMQYTLPNNTPTRDGGYRFTGWATSNGGQAQYQPGGRYGAVDSDTTFFAVWEKLYRLEYKGNAATPPANNVPAASGWFTTGSAVPITAQAPTRVGYAFDGWSENVDGSGTRYRYGAGNQNTCQVVGTDTTLYAVWTGAETVRYHANGTGVTGMPTKTEVRVVTGDSHTLPATAPSRTGYRFVGWDTQANGQGTRYMPGDTIDPVSDDIALYAIWVQQHTFSYAMQGGVAANPGLFDAVVVDSGANVTIPTESPTRIKYDFVAWNTAADGSGTSYAPGTRYSGIRANVTLYAQWEGNGRVIMTPNSGASGNEIVLRVPTDENVTLPTTIPARPGYRFTYWNTEADGSGTNYVPGGTMRGVRGTVTLYAQWVRQWSVSYHPAGGANAPGTTTYDTNTAFVLPTATPTREGHTFTGWNTLPDGTGTTYLAGARHPGLTRETMLYAQWQVHRYTLSYRGNGGTGAPADIVDVVWDTRLVVTSVAPSRDGHTFNNWNTAADGSGARYEAGDAIAMKQNLTLYAQWRTDAFTLSYNGNGGAPVPVTQRDLPWGAKITLPETPPARANYAFSGWNTAPDGSGTTYQPGEVITIRDDVTLTAQWNVDTFTLSYDGNGGEGVPDALRNIPWGAEITLAATPPTRANHTFTGWNTAANGSGTSYQPGDTLTVQGNITLTAQWQIHAFTLRFDGANGKPVPSTQRNIAWGTQITLPKTVPARTYYTFTGWNTAADGSGETYQPGGVMTVQGDTTLTAQWRRLRYTLTFNKNKGKGGPTNIKNIPANTVVRISWASPERSGYKFVGWNTKKDGSGTKYSRGSSIRIRDNVTLYAQWNRKKKDDDSDSTSVSTPPSSSTSRPPASSSTTSPPTPPNSDGNVTPPTSNATPPPSTGDGTGGTGGNTGGTGGGTSGGTGGNSRPPVSSSEASSRPGAGGVSVSGDSSLADGSDSSLPASSTPDSGPATSGGSSNLLTPEELQQLLEAGAVVGQTFTVGDLPLDTLVWEPEYFDVVYDADTGETQFTALQAGNTVVTYRDADGEDHLLVVTIREGDTPAGGLATWVWILVGVVAVLVIALLILLILLRRRRAKKDGKNTGDDS